MNNQCYLAIKTHYGDDVAKRSQLPLMNHIDEGIEILRFINARYITMQAFCIHPLIQSDQDFKRHVDSNELERYDIDVGIVLLAAEYRHWANNYLSIHVCDPNKEPTLSPIPEVNDMLIADKIQNYKDFMEHHYEKHPDSLRLYTYFHQWFKALGLEMWYVKEIIQIIK